MVGSFLSVQGWCFIRLHIPISQLRTWHRADMPEISVELNTRAGVRCSEQTPSPGCCGPDTDALEHWRSESKTSDPGGSHHQAGS